MSSTSNFEKTTAQVCNAIALRRAARHVSRAYDRALASAGLRITQYLLLLFLARRGSSTISAAAADLGTELSNLGHALRPLAREGLVTIVPDPADRRRKLIAITVSGRLRMEAGAAAWRSAQENFEHLLGHDEARDLRDAMARVSDLPLG